VELCYMGTERSKRGSRPVRRVFLWEDGRTLFQGNAEAFSVHLIEKFGLKAGYLSVAPVVHNVLCALGHRLQTRGPIVNPGVGGSKKSAPESEVVSSGASKVA
jgi:hypothetical protein